MSDITVTASMDAGRVTAGMNQVAKSSQRMNRQMSKNSMAFLEASRAIEDFSVAGMRGALNNIPGLLMHLGTGAGVAGAASLAAVGMMTATKALEKWMDRAREAKDLDLMKGFSLFNADALMTVDNLDKARKEAERMFAGTQARERDRQQLESAYDDQRFRTQEADMMVRNEQRILDLQKEGASEERIQMERLKQTNAELKRKLDFENATLRNSRLEIDNLQIRRAEQEKIVAKAEEAKRIAEDQRKKEIAAIAYDAKLSREAGRRTYDIKAPEKIAEEVRKREGMTKEREAALKSDIRQGEIAKRRIELLDEEITRTQKVIRLDEQRNAATKAELEAEARITKIAADRLRMEAARKKAEEERKLIESLAVDPGAFVGSQAKSGLSAQETKSAMEALVVQKDMLKEIREIRRNTARKQVATYGNG